MSTTILKPGFLKWDGTKYVLDPGTSGGSVQPATSSFLGGIQLAGDLGGTTGTAPRVIAINGATVPTSGSLTTGQVLQVNGVDALVYDFIVDANISTGTSIAGSKINPNFGTSTLTAGSSSIGPIINKLITNSGRRLNSVHIASNYTINSTDEIVMVENLTSAITITMPILPSDGDIYTIKDARGTITVSNTVNITSLDATNFDGATSITLNKYQAVNIIFNSNASRWNII